MASEERQREAEDARREASRAQPDASEEAGPAEEKSPDEVGDEISQELEQVRGELQEAVQTALRAQADLENFRKRTRRDYEEQLKYAAVPLMRDVLEVLDNLRRAIDAAADNEAAAGLRSGVQMVAQQLDGALAKHHCRRVPGVGEPFDPNYHEAIAQSPSDEHPRGTIAHEALPGYQLHERVVRPSQVIVSTGPASEG